MVKMKKFLIPIFFLGIFYWLAPSSALAFVNSGTYVSSPEHINWDCSSSLNDIKIFTALEVYIDGTYCADITGYKWEDFGLGNFLFREYNGQNIINQSSITIVSSSPSPVSILTLGTSSYFFDIASEIFSNIWQIIALSFGIPLAFYALREIIGLASRWGR